jgi:cytoskeletal protein RodZ
VERSEADPQVTIERAIATLEREARGDEDDDVNNLEAEAPESKPFGLGRKRPAVESPFREQPMAPETVFARAPVEERGGGSAVTIFLLVFLLLLVGAGGAGFWAWREGYIDFNAMFGKAPTSDQASKPQTSAPATPALGAAAPDNSAQPGPASKPAANNGNTESATATPPKSADQLSAAPAAQVPSATATPSTAAPAASTPGAEPSAQTAGEAPKSEDRLTQSATAGAGPASPDASKPAAATAPAGSQSLLLEAAQDGTTGAVPFSGTVEWTKGTDEMGQPTLVGKASIPARNLSVSVLIRKNTDPTLPASHLMEINFSVTDSFIGGAISGLPGVLLKNEELVQGSPLAGASARVVVNSFLFALSASPADIASNKDLLTSRKWMDLAIIYATGKKAIITLEKDDKAEQLFNDVFTAWAKAAPAAAAAPAPAASTTSK